MTITGVRPRWTHYPAKCPWSSGQCVSVPGPRSQSAETRGGDRLVRDWSAGSLSVTQLVTGLRLPRTQELDLGGVLYDSLVSTGRTGFTDNTF